MRRLVLALAAVLGLAGGLPACRGSSDPFVGKPPPSLASATGTWLGGPGIGAEGPVDVKGLIGNVVYLQFGFLR